MTARQGDWIQTYTGKQFWPLDPRPEEIDIEDIAHSLSLQCRYAGHCRCHYSVADHSIRVSYACNSEDALWGLLHDAPEAYLLDLPRPLKVSLREMGITFYDDAEEQLMDVICRRFGLPWKKPESVECADRKLLLTEKRDLMAPEPAPWGYAQGKSSAALQSEKIIPLQTSVARHMFLERFYQLMKARNYQ